MAPPPPQSRETRVKKSRSLEGEGEGEGVGGYFDTNEDVDSGVSIWSVPIYPFELILGPTPRPLTLDDARDVLREAERIVESRLMEDLSSSDTEEGGQMGTTSLLVSVELTLSEVGWSNPGGALETIHWVQGGGGGRDRRILRGLEGRSPPEGEPRSTIFSGSSGNAAHFRRADTGGGFGEGDFGVALSSSLPDRNELQLIIVEALFPGSDGVVTIDDAAGAGRGGGGGGGRLGIISALQSSAYGGSYSSIVGGAYVRQDGVVVTESPTTAAVANSAPTMAEGATPIASPTALPLQGLASTTSTPSEDAALRVSLSETYPTKMTTKTTTAMITVMPPADPSVPRPTSSPDLNSESNLDLDLDYNNVDWHRPPGEGSRANIVSSVTRDNDRSGDSGSGPDTAAIVISSLTAAAAVIAVIVIAYRRKIRQRGEEKGENAQRDQAFSASNNPDKEIGVINGNDDGGGGPKDAGSEDFRNLPLTLTPSSQSLGRGIIDSVNNEGAKEKEESKSSRFLVEIRIRNRGGGSYSTSASSSFDADEECGSTACSSFEGPLNTVGRIDFGAGGIVGGLDSAPAIDFYSKTSSILNIRQLSSLTMDI